MKKKEIFQLAGMSAFTDNIEQLAEHNPDYDLSEKELIDTGRVGERIFAFIYHPENITLKEQEAPSAVPEADTAPSGKTSEENLSGAKNDEDISGKENAEDIFGEKNDTDISGEEKAGMASGKENGAVTLPADRSFLHEVPRHDPRLFVYADGEPVGTVLSRQAGLLRRLMQENRFREITLTIQGGPYKILLPEADDTIVTERDTAGMYAFLSVEYEDNATEELPAEAAGSESGYSYISTTYETAVLQEDPGKRGRGCMVLALLLSGAYLTFSGLYWWFVRTGKLQPLAWLGGNFTDTVLYPHLGIAVGGFLLAIISVLTGYGLFPMLAAIALLGSCYALPGYAVFLALPALFCAIGALRRRSHPALTFFKVITLLAVLGVSGWFLKDTARNFLETRHFALLPTWGYDPGAASEDEDSFGYSDEEGYADADFDDEGYDDEDYDDEDYDDDDFDDEDFDDEGNGDWG